MGWEHQRCGRVTTAIIQQDDIPRLRIALGKLMQKNLAVGSIQMRSFQKKAFAGRGLDRSIPRKVLKARLYCAQGLHAAQRKAPSLNRQEPKAAFIPANDADRARSW